MTAYQLQDGLLTTSNTDFGQPTGVPGTLTTPASPGWSCQVASGPTANGVGALLMNWYQQQNGPNSTSATS